MSEQNYSFMDRVNALGRNASVMSRVSRQVGEFIGTAVDSGAELGSFVPVVEIIVTIGSFIGAGLGDTFGYEVLIGLVLAQIVALYLVAHYKEIAMHGVGQAAIYLAVGVGAVNTAIAIYLALTSHDGTAVNPVVWQFPAYSSGAAILFFYCAKLFTHEAMANRRRLRVESENEIAEIQRSQAAKRAMNAARDGMQQTRLGMEADAMEELANDERMQAIQKRAMYLTTVQAIMNQYEVKATSKLGKQLLELADEAVNGTGVRTDERPFNLEDLRRIYDAARHAQNEQQRPKSEEPAQLPTLPLINDLPRDIRVPDGHQVMLLRDVPLGHPLYFITPQADWSEFVWLRYTRLDSETVCNHSTNETFHAYPDSSVIVPSDPTDAPLEIQGVRDSFLANGHVNGAH